MIAIITGDEIKREMSRAKITIRQLSQRMGITQKRIRQIRDGERELTTLYATRDWIEGITGNDPGLLFRVAK